MGKYLVTGGAGFIGSNIVAAFADAGHDVIVSDWLRTDERWKNLAKHVVQDILHPEQLAGWLRKNGASLDGVIHMGAISLTTETDVDALIDNNIRLSIDLWTFCAEAKVPFLFASSAATYGDGTAGFTDFEDSANLAKLHPLSAYGWSKHSIDKRIARLRDNNGLTPPQWVGVKFFNVYGPNEYHKGPMKSVIAQNARKIAGGETLHLFKSYHPKYKDGHQLRDFIYVKDCVKIIQWFFAHPEKSGLFNIGTGSARSWLDMAHAMFAAADMPEKVEFIDMPQDLRAKYQYCTEANMAKLRAAGYAAPITSLEDGIRDYMQNYLLTDDPYL